MSTSFVSRTAIVCKQGPARVARKTPAFRASVPVGLKASLPRRPARFVFSTRAEESKSETEVSQADATSAQDRIDPADGSIAEGAPMGDKGNQMLGEFGSMFSNPRSTEILNGRAAMIGFAAAIWFEVTKGTSLVNQVFAIRTFTLMDGNSTTTQYPGAGFYLAALTVLVVVAASWFPKANKMEGNGTDEEPKPDASPLPRFTADIEMFNGRAAMVGLVALAVTEAILGRAEF